MKQDEADGAPIIPGHLFMLRAGLRHAPLWIVSTFAIEAFHRVVIFFEHTYSLKFIIDTITSGGPFWHVAAYVGAVASAVALCIGLQAVLGEWIRPTGAARVHQGLQRELFSQAAALELSAYESPSFYNDYIQAVGKACERFDGMMERMRTICVSAVSAAMAIGFVALRDPAGFVIVAAALPLSLLVSRQMGKRQFALETESLPLGRKMGYVSRVFYLSDQAKELRMSGAASRLLSEHEAATEANGAVIRRHSRAITGLFFLQWATPNFLYDGLYFSYLAVRALVWKNIGLGDIVALSRSLGDIVWALNEVAAPVPDMKKDALYVSRMRDFLERKPSIAAPEEPLPLPPGPWELELRDVGFSYPAAEGKVAEPVLSGIRMKIRQGEKLAIVGHNGAGKTSLVKLLMRLYDPTEGSILLNGTDIRSFEPEAYRRLISTVFQDFQIFAATLGENVVLDRLEPGQGQGDRIHLALERSGFGERLAAMEAGIGTPLTREFEDNGVNLSGGENQKVALARVFAKPAPAAILDEPSSALDPESEYRLNADMAVATKDRAVVWISHRLSSTRDADRIVHLEKGRIIEEGSHAELMERNGPYATMFRMQAERYRPPVEAY